MTTDFPGKGYSKNRLICDCAGEPIHVITTLLSNSLFFGIRKICLLITFHLVVSQRLIELQCQSEIFNLRMVPTIAIAHTFCASRDTRMGGVF